MAKSIYEKFLSFKIRHNLSNDVIAKMATEYANSDLEFARTHFSKKYSISNSVFYKCRDYAVIFCLVDEQTCKKLRTKSAANYNGDSDTNLSVASLAHFDELIVQRKNFLNSFSNNEIQDIAQKYLDGVSVANIAFAYGTGEFAIKYLLKKGIIMLILDYSIVKQISIIVGPALNNILKKREANKKYLLKCIQNEITFLNSQIACYYLYFRDFKSKPDLEELKTKLSNAIKMYNETLQL